MTILRFLGSCFIVGLLSITTVHADDLLQQAQDNLAAGYYQQAQQQLQQLATDATLQHDDYSATLVQGLQGLLALYRQQYVLAEDTLNIALAQAQQHSWQDLSARFNLYLAQVNQQQAQLDAAKANVTQAITAASKLSDKSLLISSLTQAAKLALVQHKNAQAWTSLQQTTALLEGLAPSANSSQLWLNTGYQLSQLYLAEPEHKDDYLVTAFQHLNKALSLAKQNQQRRTQAGALKHLASLYQQQNLQEDASKLLLEAISLAQQDNAEDSLVDLEWQLGRIYQTQQQRTGAIAAYKRALQHLDAIRLDIPVSYEKGVSSFKTTFAPLYSGLADLLLQQAPVSNKSEQQALLQQAQDVIEDMNKSELEDYFQSRCAIPAVPLDLKTIDPKAAALYPIQLNDRLELIVYTAQGLQQFTQAIPNETLEQQARLFSGQLRKYAKFEKTKPQAEFLYQALVEPIIPLLKDQHIETLIYVPHGALRSIPLSALYDGKKFVIEDYAVVTSPGMSLIASNTDKHPQNAILFAGVSTPGDVVRDLPDSILGGLVESVAAKGPEKRQLSRYLKQWQEGEQKRELNSSEQVQKTRALHELLETTTLAEKLQEMLSLPGVDKEVKQLAEQNSMSYILNKDFSLENFSNILIAQPYKSLHIASHGFFGATTEESFVMTHNKILTMNNLEVLLNSPHFKKYPLDLIVLSACQTAEGDDRSPLGISGIAIKAKVHSALGSLWPVSDKATEQLMTRFYSALKKPNYSKAKALQEAELSLLKQKRFLNPSLWSPFILVGDWK